MINKIRNYIFKDYIDAIDRRDRKIEILERDVRFLKWKDRDSQKTIECLLRELEIKKEWLNK